VAKIEVRRMEDDRELDGQDRPNGGKEKSEGFSGEEAKALRNRRKGQRK
jgi:hypothetical protein